MPSLGHPFKAALLVYQPNMGMSIVFWGENILFGKELPLHDGDEVHPALVPSALKGGG